MRDLLVRGPIEIRRSTIDGYGVFALRDIAQDEIIEECRVLVLASTVPPLGDYVIGWGGKNSSLRGMPLGYGALYNHADDPNAHWHTVVDEGLMVITAARWIPAGEEITISYGKGWFWARNRESR